MTIREIAIFSQQLFYGMISASVAGSVYVILFLLLEHTPYYRNHRLKLLWMKAAVMFYLVPVAAGLVVLSRSRVSFDGIVWISDFWRSSSKPMQKGYLLLEGIVLSGLLTGLVFRMIQYRKLKAILHWNVSVSNSLCSRMIEEYREHYKLKNVSFYQNELLEFPICAGIFRPMIILPVKDYTEKQLHMILEHEISHIRRGDLIWKKITLLVTYIHWWNPFAYILLKKIVFQEEVECDITACTNNSSFSMKEYVLYLSGMEEGSNDMIFASALCKTKSNTIRRIEGMVKRKNYTKRAALVSCLVLSVLSVLPSYAAAEGVARLNEQWMAETSKEMRMEQVDYTLVEEESTVAMEADVQELDISLGGGIDAYSTTVTLDRTIAANTRILYKWQQFSQGDAVTVLANCSDSSIVYRVGIRDSNGDMRYVQGSGSITHVFTIPSNGSYTVYVQNTNSSKSMQVTGRAYYNFD